MPNSFRVRWRSFKTNSIPRTIFVPMINCLHHHSLTFVLSDSTSQTVKAGDAFGLPGQRCLLTLSHRCVPPRNVFPTKHLQFTPTTSRFNSTCRWLRVFIFSRCYMLLVFFLLLRAIFVILQAMLILHAVNNRSHRDN